MNQGILCTGDVETAYAEVLCFGDNRGLIELMNITGPIRGALGFLLTVLC